MDTLRISDADRERTAERLSAAVGDGRLDLATYDERLQHVYRAATGSELDEIVADLRPAPAVARPHTKGGQARAWRIWLAVSVLQIAIWAITSLASGHPLYFWPVWPIVGWGVAMAFGGRHRRI